MLTPTRRRTTAAATQSPEIVEEKRGVTQRVSHRRAGAVGDSVSKVAPRESPVVALLSRYGVRETPSRPVERFLVALAKVEGFLQQPLTLLLDPKAKGAAFRTAVFAVEGLMRLANDRFGEPFDKRLARVKKLEDALGARGHAGDMLAHADRTGDADAIAYWKNAVEKTGEALEKTLTSRWLPAAGDDAEIRKLVRDIVAAPFADGAKDTQANAKSFEREATKVVQSELDMHVLDELHELRRKSRWFAIAARGFDGGIVLTDARAPERWRALTSDPAASSEFAQIPASTVESNPVTIPRVLFIAISKYIDELGRLKDDGEAIEGISEALQAKRGLSAAKADVEAARLLNVPADAHARSVQRAEEIYAELKDVFAAIAADLKTQS